MTRLKRVEVGRRLVGAVLADRALRPADAGRVDEHAHRAHRLGHLDGVDDVVGLGDVDLGERPADLVGERLALVLLQVGDDDLRAPRRQQPRRRRADPRSPTRHDRSCTSDVHVAGRYVSVRAGRSQPGRAAAARRGRRSLLLPNGRARRPPRPPAPSPPGGGTRASSLNVPLWSTSTWQTDGLDDTRKRATGMRPGEFYSRYANPTVRAFEDAVADLEGAEDALAFGSGMGAIASTVLALCSAGDHIVDPAPDLRRHDGVRAGAVRPLRHRAHRRRRHRPGRLRRGRAARPHDARARREPVQPAPRPRRPRRPRRRQRPVHRRRLDVRHADRPAAAAPRRRPRAALGDQGHLRPQRRHPRRGRRRARPARRDLVLRRAARRHAVAARRPQRAARHPHAGRAPAPPGRRRPAPRRARCRPPRRGRRPPPRPRPTTRSTSWRRASSRACRRCSRSTSPAASTPPAR